MASHTEAVHDLAPSGTLRAAINFGNPVLAQRDAASGDPRGVSAALARELARRLGVPIAFVPYDQAGKVVEAVRSGAWDIAFLAIDPTRATEIAFTAPYVIIEGGYAVSAASPLRTADEVDRPQVRIAVVQGSAYELHLARTIKHAALIRSETFQGSLERFRNEGLDALAGIRSALVRLAAAEPGLRVLDGRFMAIEQAMATRRGRDAGLLYLQQFVAEMKQSGFVQDELARSGQQDATVAP